MDKITNGSVVGRCFNRGVAIDRDHDHTDVLEKKVGWFADTMHSVPSRNIRPHAPQCSRAVLAHSRAKDLKSSEDWFKHDEAEKRVFEKYDRRKDLPQLRERFFLEKEGKSYGKIPCDAPGEAEGACPYRRKVLSEAIVCQDEKLMAQETGFQKAGYRQNAEVLKADRAQAATTKGCHIALRDALPPKRQPDTNKKRLVPKVTDTRPDIEASVQRLSKPKNVALDDWEDWHRNPRRRTANAQPVKQGESLPTSPRQFRKTRVPPPMRKQTTGLRRSASGRHMHYHQYDFRFDYVPFRDHRYLHAHTFFVFLNLHKKILRSILTI